MARQETIKILRSEVPSATPSLTAGEVAVNLADRKFFIGGTGGTSDRITFRDERSTVWSVNSLTGSVTLGVGQLSDVNFEDAPEQYQFLQWNGVDEWRPAYAVTSLNNQIGSVTLTGDGESLIGRTNNSFTNRTATTGVTGVASFLSNHFTVSETGHVSSKGVITINNTSPDGNGNFNVAAATVVTGDGGSLRGDGVVITARFSSTGISGVASFSSDDFDVSATGHVTVKSGGIGNAQLANSSFTFRDSVQGSDTISLGNTLNLTGGPGISVRRTETDTFAVQGTTATTSTLGVASFNSSYFSVSSGAVSLASPYQATGDSVQAGHGIAISANKTIFNIGVTAFNGLTGNITVTGDGGSLVGRDNNKFTNRLATISVTGVASFMPSYFSVDSGAVSLAATYQATGDTVVGSANIGVTRVGNSVTITNIGVTGIGFGSDVGLTGKVNITAGSNITITQSGNLITFSGVAQQVTAVTGDGAAIVGRDNSYITARLATTGVTGVASFLSNHFTVSGTGHVSLASAYQATGDSVQAGSGIAISANKTISNIGVTGFNGLTGNITVTGDGGSLVGRDNNKFTNRLATISVTGVASFMPSYFSVDSGAVSLASPYQATGDSVQAGHGIAISANKTIFNIGVTGIGFGSDVGLTGKVNITAGSNITITQSGNLITFSGVAQQVTAVTGDGAAIVGRDNSYITARLATTGVTGVASFLSTYFTVSGTGHVSLASAYQATGDSVQAGSGIAISANKTISNIGVTGFNGLTGSVTVTGDGGSLVGAVNNKFTNRLATTGVTGVASFLSNHFTVSGTGHVSLASAYQATGDSVQAGSGIAISANKTIFNIGVTSFNGLTGTVSLTGCGGAVRGSDNTCITVRNASSTLTGVASFNPTHFTVATTGHVSLASAYQATGDSIVAGSNITIVRSNNQVTINANEGLASGTLTGVASFNSTYFSVGATGHVLLSAAYQATGDSVQAGHGIAISANKTIFNIGVTGFNGLTGSVTVTGDGGSLVGKDNNKFTNRLADAAATGVASFNSTYFSVGGTGHVILAAAYQATGDTVITVPGSGIALSTSGKTDTIFNIGVTGFNGLTGNITVTGDGGSLIGRGNTNFTNRTATTGVTGVASFNSTYFSVGSTGHVILAAAYQATGDTVITVPGSGIALSTSGKTDTIFNIGVTGFNGLTGNITVTGDGGSLVGRDNNKFTNRITQLWDNTASPTTGLTGVSMFRCRDFVVSPEGLVSLAAFSQCEGDVSGCNCADFTTEATCVSPCEWFIPFPFGTPTCRCTSAFNSLYSGLGVSADANGELAFLYFDIGNLSAAPSGTTILSTDSILFYDASESGLIKTKRATISKLILDNNNLFTVPSKSSNQLTTTRGSSAIEFDVVLGQVAANNQGLIKGATAFAYIEQNTVRTINGLTGALQAVGSINGCSGNSLTITGTVNEVNVTNSCPTITIGLPDNVTIPYISGTGATFTGIVNANLFIGSVDGGTF